VNDLTTYQEKKGVLWLKRKGKSKSSSGLLIFFAIFFFIVVPLMKGVSLIYEKVDGYYNKQEKQTALKEIEESGLSNRLIPVAPLKELIRKEFPNVQLEEEEKASYLSAAYEKYVFKAGKSRVTIGLHYFTEESYNGQFNGMIDNVFLVYNYEDIPFDSPLLKKLLKVISIGLSRELSDKQINQFLQEASISKSSTIELNGINFTFSDAPVTKRFGKQPIADISVSVIDEKEAFKVYQLNEELKK
jgi:hypothetical protein